MIKYEYFIQYEWITSDVKGDGIPLLFKNNEFFTSASSGQEAVGELRRKNPDKNITITQITKL